MKKKQYFIIVLLLLVFNSNTTQAQENLRTNNKGQYLNTVCIKFKPDQAGRLDNALRISKNASGIKRERGDRYAKVGISEVDKVSRALKTSTFQRVFRPAGKNEEKHRAYGLHLWYRVTYDASINVKDAIAQFKNSGIVEVAHELYKAKPIEESLETTKSVTSHQNESMKMNRVSVTNDPMYKDQWHYNNIGQKGGTTGRDIHLEEAWEIEKGDARVIVAIQDSGIDINHPDLKGNLWVNQGEIPGNGVDDDNNGYIDDIHGYSFLRNGNGTIPAGDHGTHVAGTVAASTNNGIGVAGVAGGTGNNDGVRLMACAVIGLSTPGGGAESFVYAADNGAVISQNSYSFSGFSDEKITAHKEAVNYFIENAGGANKAMNGGIVFFSAANDNTNLVKYPNTHDPIIMVSALDNKDKKAGYSNYGTWVDIAAPGGGGQGGVLSTLPGESYGYKQGTSMACPHMSGVAALVISNNYGNITPQQLRRVLEETVDPIDHLNPGYENQLGTGRVNAYKALQVGNGVGIPLGLRAQNITETSATISWNQIAGTQQYTLRYKKVSDNNWTTITSSSTSKSLNNLEEGEEYELQVNAGTSSYSYILQFTTKISSLGAPTGISFSDITETSTLVQWSPTSGASGYVFEYKEDVSTDWDTILVDQGTTVGLQELTQKTKYNVRIKATNASVESLYSAITSFTTKASKCGDITPWKPTQYRTKGTQVSYQDAVYENKWWAEANHIPGVHEVWLKIRDCGGSDVNQEPIVTITSLQNNQSIGQLTLSSITLSANANDPDGSIASIQFDINGTSLTQGNNVDWIPPAFGEYTIKVTATDDKGAIATDQIKITIFQEDQTPPPTVSITSPTDGQVIEQDALTTIQLSANASDPDGTIVKVQFEVNNTLQQEGNNISWLPTSFGDYKIEVTVTDNDGATATDVVNITIKETISSGDCQGITPWNAATEYAVKGIKVSHKNNIYVTKWWTQNNEPGTGGPWGPWELVEPCSAVGSKAYTYLLDNNKDSFLVGIKSNQMEIITNQREKGNFTFKLFSIDGRYTRTLKSGYLAKGIHTLNIDISDLSRGFYLIKSEQVGLFHSTKKIIIRN